MSLQAAAGSGGVFDQNGCPLVVFPVEGHAKFSEISKTEVVDFIKYFQCLHSKKQEKQSLVSVVGDLRDGSLSTTRFIAETLLLLEQYKRTVHSVYIIQPKKKDVLKLLLKLLAPSKSHTVSFRKILLKEVPELYNYIDRSQLPASLGGYLMYCHNSWVGFIKEIHTFLQEFLCVLQRLPSYIAELQVLSRLPLPSSFSELQHFCITNEAKFLLLRRELGLDELLRHCETMVDKLRHPDREPCYQAMAGTALFTHTAFDMLQNHSRITAAVEKVELLWKHAFSKAHLQLQLFQLRSDALQITEKIETHQEKLQLYTTEVTKSFAKAEELLSTFEMTIYTPAMELLQCAEHVIHTLKEILPLDAQTKESWALDLAELKENLHTDVHITLQTLRAVSNYHYYYNKANSWYSLVLCENFHHELLSEVHGNPLSTKRQSRNWENVPAWRQRLSSFLKKNPAPKLEELLHLVHLSSAIPDKEVQQMGRSIFQRCMMLKKLLISSEPVLVEQLQQALQWQYELLRSGHLSQSSDNAVNEAYVHRGPSELNCENAHGAVNPFPPSPSPEVSGLMSADWKSPSFSSLNSGFHGAGRSQEVISGGEDQQGLLGNQDSMRDALRQPQEEKVSIISDCENNLGQVGLGSVGNSSEASIKIIPKVEVEFLNDEFKVKRLVAPPNNPWLSLPVDDLENSYTVTIAPKPMPQKRDLWYQEVPGCHTIADQANGSRDQYTQEVLRSSEPIGPQSLDWNLYSDGDFSDPELSSSDEILSSTITDGRDESSCSTEGIPTLLWDSYDLHNEKPDAVDSVVNVSLKDWEVKEQESLREVEKILERADGILEEEENVLAQEDELDVLLRVEDRRDDWWDTDDKLGMSSGELAEAAVVGLEDHLHVGEPDDPGELDSARESEVCLDEFYSEAEGLIPNRLHLTVIDELQHDEGSSTGGPSGSSHATQEPSVLNKDREAFRLQLEKEKRELEALEKSLYEEDEFKKHTDTTKGVVRCSVKEKLRNGVDEPLGSELSSLEGVNPTLAEPETLHSNKVCDLPPSLMAPDPGSQPAVEDDSLGSFPKNTTPDLGNRFGLNSNVKEHRNNNNNKLLLFDSCDSSLENIYDTTEDESDSLVVPDCLETDQRLTEKVFPSSPLCPNEPPEFEPSRTNEVTGGFHKGFQSSEAVRTSSGGSLKMQTSNSDIREVTDFSIPIVLDSGSGFTKAGFADQELPNIVFPTIIGVPKYEEIMNGNLERDVYIGLDAQQMRGILALKRPIRNGIIGNWDDMEKIWHHTFQQLSVEPEDHPVLLTEAAMNPLENRQRAVEIMFEAFNVPFTYVAMQAVLALYAAGRTSGVVFDSGDGVSHSVPVFEGYCLPHAVQRFPLAGLDVTIQLKKLLQEQGVSMRTTAEEEIVREMKERCCCVALHYEAELSRGGSSCGEVHYTMPDGQIVTLGTERFRAPEILFKPELIGREHYGMHESIFKSILSSDIDLRRSLLENVVLSGGNTLLPGLPERLQAELKGLVSADMGVSVRVRSPKDRDFLVWSGGTVLASLPTFSSAWISQEEYEEYGPQIVFRKCF